MNEQWLEHINLAQQTNGLLSVSPLTSSPVDESALFLSATGVGEINPPSRFAWDQNIAMMWDF